ncbi:MAG: hypothetical protein JW913_06375, partial [Chitinispirillaceae bacterium]|nr:hypothetical protein [Chitinispirillaceae bacterium]
MRKTVKMLALTTGAVVLICSLSGCFLRHTGGTDNPLGVPSLTDIDGDKVDDIDDNDIDGDGIINEQDSDIDGDGKANTEDNDIDGDGIININDNDIDGDG